MSGASVSTQWEPESICPIHDAMPVVRVAVFLVVERVTQAHHRLPNLQPDDFSEGTGLEVGVTHFKHSDAAVSALIPPSLPR